MLFCEYKIKVFIKSQRDEASDVPKKFSEQEKERIRAKLLEAGLSLFGRLGLQKTSVEQLTRAAGISQGAFYLFYASKEELMFEIMELEEAGIRERMFAKYGDGAPLTADVLRNFLLDSLRMM